MYRLAIDTAKPGMKIGQNIYSATGTLLLKKNIELTESLIKQLKQRQITSLYISSNFPYINTPIPPPIIQEKTRLQAIATIKDSFYKCRLAPSAKLNTLVIHSIVNELICNILASKELLVQTTDIRQYDDYTFAHSINVAVLATMIGVLLNYNKKRLFELCWGAMVHDIGKTQIPIAILNKEAPLTKEEFEIIQSHSKIGFDMLRQNSGFSVVPMHVAFQHHEKFDGSGYPRRLTGNDIHEYARIVAIADVYDALTSDRAYKKACSPDIAYHIMTQKSKGHFDEQLLDLFFSNIAIYPIGSIVRLQLGYYGVVVEVHKGFTPQPLIRLIADENKDLFEHPAIIDLRDAEEKYQINYVLKGNELINLFMHAHSEHLSS